MESSSPLSGDTPPRQGTHVLAARSDIVEVILPLARATLSPLPSRPLELFEMRKEPAPCEAKPIRLLLVSHANGAKDSHSSSRYTRPAGGGRRRVRSHRNVAEPPAL